jgi:hypothetical protein
MKSKASQENETQLASEKSMADLSSKFVESMQHVISALERGDHGRALEQAKMLLIGLEDAREMHAEALSHREIGLSRANEERAASKQFRKKASEVGRA